MTRQERAEQLKTLIEGQNGPVADLTINSYGRMNLQSRSAAQAHDILLDLLRAGLRAKLIAPDSDNPYCDGSHWIRCKMGA